MSKLSSKGDTKPNHSVGGGVNHHKNHRRRNSSPSKETTRKRKQVDTPFTTSTPSHRPNYLSPTISSAKKARKGPLFAATASSPSSKKKKQSQTKVLNDDMAATFASELPHHHQGKKEDRASSPSSSLSSSSGLDLLATMATTTTSHQQEPPQKEPQSTTSSSSSTYCFQVTSQQPLLSVVQGSADGTLQTTSLSSTVSIQQGLWLVGLPDHDSVDYNSVSQSEVPCSRWSLGHAEASHSVQDANDIDIQELELSSTSNSTSTTSTSFVALVAHSQDEQEQVLIPPSLLLASRSSNHTKEITTWSNGCLWNFTSLQRQRNHNNRLKLILVLDHRRQSEQPLISMDVILMHNDGSNPQAMLQESSDLMVPSSQQPAAMQRPSTPALGALATRTRNLSTRSSNSNEDESFDLDMNAPVQQRLLQRDLFGTHGRSKKAPDIPTSQKEPSSSGTKPKTTVSYIQEDPSSFSKARPRQAVVKTCTTGNSSITALSRSNHHKRPHSVGTDNSSSSLSNKSKPSNKTSSPSVSLQRYWKGNFATSSSFPAVPPATDSKKLSTTHSSKKQKIVGSTTKSNTKGTASLSNKIQPQPATSSKRKHPTVASASVVKKNKSKTSTVVPAASSTRSFDDDSFDQEAAARAVRLYHQQQDQANGNKPTASMVKVESSVSSKSFSKKAVTTKQKKLAITAYAKQTLRNGGSAALQKHLDAWDSFSDDDDDDSNQSQPIVSVSKTTASSALSNVTQGSSSTTPKPFFRLSHGNRVLSFGKTSLSSTKAKETSALNGTKATSYRRPQHSSSNSSSAVHNQVRSSSTHDVWSDDDDDSGEDPLPTKLRFSLGGCVDQQQQVKVVAGASFQTAATDVVLKNKKPDEDHHLSDEDQDFEDAQFELNVPEWDTNGTLNSSFRWGSYVWWLMMMLLASSIVALLTIGMLGTRGSSFRFQHYFAFDLGKITSAIVVAGQQIASNLEDLCSFLADLSKSSVRSLASIKQESVFWLRSTQTFAAFQYSQIAGFVVDRSSWPLLPPVDAMLGTLFTWIQLAGGFVEPSELELDSSFEIKLADFLLHLQAESNIRNI